MTKTSNGYTIRWCFILLVLLSVFTTCSSSKLKTINARVVSVDRDSRALVDLAQRFKIEKPTFRYAELQFDLEFVVSDIMNDTFVNYEVYDGHGCRQQSADITQNGYLYSRMRPDLHPVGDGSGNRTMKVSLNIDPDTISSSPIYEDSITYANVNFCVRFMNYNMDYLEPDALEVNFIETQVTLTISLVDGFEIETQVKNADSVLQLAYDDTAVEGYICDFESNVIEGDIKNQGESIRICVVPTEETMKEGAYLRYIDEFTFRRDDHEQVAIESGTEGAPATQLTIVSCEPGSSLCAFETLLGAEFFSGGVGIVSGSGTAFLQFGSNEAEQEGQERRRMQTIVGDWGDKSIDEVLGERPTKFSFEIVAVPVEGRKSAAFYPSIKSSFFVLGLLVSAFL